MLSAAVEVVVAAIVEAIAGSRDVIAGAVIDTDIALDSGVVAEDKANAGVSPEFDADVAAVGTGTVRLGSAIADASGGANTVGGAASGARTASGAAAAGARTASGAEAAGGVKTAGDAEAADGSKAATGDANTKGGSPGAAGLAVIEGVVAAADRDVANADVFFKDCALFFHLCGNTLGILL